MKKIFILLLLINFLTPTFASFPIEKNKLNKKTIQLTKNNDRQLLGNLSLICGGLAAISLTGGAAGLLFLCLPAIVLGIMSLNTKGRIQGIFGLILGLAELLLIIFFLVIFSSVLGWGGWS